MISIIFVKN